MPFVKGQHPNPEKEFKPGNPGGGRPKGSRNWSTLIRELIEDENFTVEVAKGVFKKYPGKVIAEVMIEKAVQGDVQAAKWLRETGYGNRLTVGGDRDNPVEMILRQYELEGKSGAETSETESSA